ncbi:MAG: PAS domain S-box protein, partial [Candidatus Dadabacteria bacterium]
LMHAAALRDSSGRVRGFLTQIVDRRSSHAIAAALARQLEYSRVASALALRFINVPTREIDHAIVEALRYAAEFAGVMRAGVFLARKGTSVLEFTHEWHAPGREPIKDRVAPIPTAMFPWWHGELAESHIVAVDDLAEVEGLRPEARAFLDALSVRSFAAANIVAPSGRLGLLSFAASRARPWTADQLAILEIASQQIGALIERVEREARLAETSELFARLAASIDHLVWVAEVDPPRVVYASPAHERLFGISPEEVYRNPGVIFSRIVPADRRRFAQVFSSVPEPGESREEEFRIVAKSGETRWIRTRVFPLAAEREGRGRIAGVSEDVTERVLAKKRTVMRAELFRLVSGIATEFLTTPSQRLEERLRRALEQLGRFAGVDEAYLMVLRDPEGQTEKAYWWTADGREDARERFEGFSLARFPWVRERVARGEIVWLPRLDAFPPEAAAEREACERAGLVSAFTIPLRVGQGVRALFGFNSRRPQEDWSPETVGMFRVAAEMLASAVARQRVERRLAALRERHRLILEAAGEGIYGLDCEGRTTFVNAAAARMIGWSREELIGRRQHDVLHHHRSDGSPYPAEECPIYAAFRDGRTRTIEGEVFWRRDGTCFPVDYVSTPIWEDGRIQGAVVVFRDASERMRLSREQARRESILTLIGQLAADFINRPLERMAEAIAAALKSLLDFAGVERAGLFLLEGDGRWARLAHEATRDGVPMVPDEFRRVMIDSLPGLRRALENSYIWQSDVSPGGVFQVPEEARRWMQSLGINTALHIPVNSEGKAIGWLGLGTAQPGRQWSAEDLHVFSVAAELFASVEERRRSLLQLERLRRFERTTSELAGQLLAARDDEFHATVETGLGRLAEGGDFDYAQILLLDEESSQYAIRYAWSREEAPMLPVGTSFSVADAPYLARLADRRESLVIQALEELPAEAQGLQRVLERLSVKSVLLVPLAEGARPLGFLLFARYREEAPWSKAFQGLATVAADILAAAFARRRSELRAERHLSELARVLRVGTLSELAADIVHEVRQPISSICVFVGGVRTQLERGKCEAARLAVALDGIEEQARRAEAIVAGIERHVRKGPPSLEWAELNEIVRDVLRLARREVERAGISLELEPAAALPPVHLDVVQIQQVILNLVRNAADALREKGGG